MTLISYCLYCVTVFGYAFILVDDRWMVFETVDMLKRVGLVLNQLVHGWSFLDRQRESETCRNMDLTIKVKEVAIEIFFFFFFSFFGKEKVTSTFIQLNENRVVKDSTASSKRSIQKNYCINNFFFN